MKRKKRRKQQPLRHRLRMRSRKKKNRPQSSLQIMITRRQPPKRPREKNRNCQNQFSLLRHLLYLLRLKKVNSKPLFSHQNLPKMRQTTPQEMSNLEKFSRQTLELSTPQRDHSITKLTRCCLCQAWLVCSKITTWGSRTTCWTTLTLCQRCLSSSRSMEWCH